MSNTVKDQVVHETKIDIAIEARTELIGILNQQMADNADHYSQAKQAHWNVKGMNSQILQLYKLTFNPKLRAMLLRECC